MNSFSGYLLSFSLKISKNTAAAKIDKVFILIPGHLLTSELLKHFYFDQYLIWTLQNETSVFQITKSQGGCLLLSWVCRLN